MFSFFLFCDPVGIQTQDLQNRNLTLYSAKLRDLSKSECKSIKKNTFHQKTAENNYSAYFA